jgi:O-antigen/teichoic acid export membrane protein
MRTRVRADFSSDLATMGARIALPRAAVWRALGGDIGWQTAVLYGSQLGSSALNALFLAAVARSLTKEQFDVFTLCAVSLLPNLGYVFEFGVFSAGARLLAVAADRQEERRLLGALLAAGVSIGALFALAVAACAPLVDGLYRTHAQGILLAAAPLAAVVPLQQFVEVAGLSTNRIGLLSGYRVALAVSNIGVAAALMNLGVLTPKSAVAGTLAASALCVGLVAIALRPSVRGVAGGIRPLLAATREYGLRMYTARLVSFASARLDTLLVPYLVGTANIGLYSAAQKLTQPMSSLARAMAATRFKAFANGAEVSARVFAWNVAMLSGVACVMALAGPLVFLLLFGDAYRAGVPLLVPFTLVALLAGLVQPFNIFLAAHGRGRELRNISLLVGTINCLGLLIVVPVHGLLGAAWWACLSALVHLLAHLGYYRTARSDLSDRAPERSTRGSGFE